MTDLAYQPPPLGPFSPFAILFGILALVGALMIAASGCE
jgi:hypothetical protein